MKLRKGYLITVTIIAVLSILAFSVLFFHGGYHNKVLSRLGFETPEAETDWALYSWDSCLAKLHYDVDIAFFGDSLTRGGDFQEAFSDKKTINLGYSGDTIENITDRVSMLTYTSPEQIFLMVGINSLSDDNCDECLQEYSTLLTSIKQELPDAQVYVQSVLPISEEKEKIVCSNDTIKAFNSELKKLTEQNQMTYINLHSDFVEDNHIKANLSKDGLHINEKGYEVWVNAIEVYIN